MYESFNFLGYKFTRDDLFLNIMPHPFAFCILVRENIGIYRVVIGVTEGAMSDIMKEARKSDNKSPFWGFSYLWDCITI